MPLERGLNGTWTLELDESEQSRAEESHPSYFDALPRYLTALDPVFTNARDRSEFQFLLAIFAIRGMQDAGWDPYETTMTAIDSIRRINKETTNDIAQKHLMLWIYGHIMEASEPYEFLANLIDISQGGTFRMIQFPPSGGGAPQSPSKKIRRLQQQANVAGMPDAVTPMVESWDANLRNAVFHADYCLYGAEVRTIRPLRRYEHDEVLTLVNRALAYHEAVTFLRRLHIQSYEEPIEILCSPDFSGDPNEKAVVIVREGHGAVGLKDAWTKEELKAGKIPFRLGRMTRPEIELLDNDRTLALLPPLEAQPGTD